MQICFPFLEEVPYHVALAWASLPKAFGGGGGPGCSPYPIGSCSAPWQAKGIASWCTATTPARCLFTPAWFLETFEHVASYVDDRQVGISASGWHILEEDKEEEEELPGLDKLR